VDIFKIGERVVRLSSERTSTLWAEPSPRELLQIELSLLGLLLLLLLVLVSIVGAGVSWHRRRGRLALACAALSLVCTWIVISVITS
jgi:hypothetical protein